MIVGDGFYDVPALAPVTVAMSVKVPRLPLSLLALPIAVTIQSSFRRTLCQLSGAGASLSGI